MHSFVPFRVNKNLAISQLSSPAHAAIFISEKQRRERPSQISICHISQSFRVHGAVYLKAADIRDLLEVLVQRWKLDLPTHRQAVRDQNARARDIPGNEIKKIANNSNPNCHGHIPRQTAI